LAALASTSCMAVRTPLMLTILYLSIAPLVLWPLIFVARFSGL
jgi:hypothetical protein